MITDVSSIDLTKLTLDEVLKLARIDETEVIELKDNLIKPADISDYVTQFANNRGGLLIFGINNKCDPSGKIKAFDKQCEIGIQEGALSTTPSVSVQIQPFQSPDKSWIIVVKIPKPIDGIKRLSSQGALVKRVSSRRAVIQPLEIYETQVLSNATVEDLDSYFIETFFNRIKQKASFITLNKESLLELFQIMRRDVQGVFRPTIAGMILFGKSPDVWVSGTRVNIIRYADLQKSGNVEDSIVLTGPIIKSMAEATQKVLTLIRRPSYQISGKRHEISEYPFEAIREAIHNAFFHNDYQIPGNIFIELFPDRLEIRNMGVPLGGTRLIDLVDKPKHRNRILLKVLSELGFVEGWGIGLRTMLDTLRSHGLPEPVLSVSNEETRINFRTHMFLDKDTLVWLQDFTSKTVIDMNFRQILALAFAKHQKRITNALYQKINGVTTHVAGNELRELCSSGFFIQLGRGKSSYYTLAELFNQDEQQLEQYFPKNEILALGQAQRKILSIVAKFGQINAKQIFYQSGYGDERGVKRILNFLVRLVFVIRTGKSISDPSAFYEINRRYQVKPDQAQKVEQLKFKID